MVFMVNNVALGQVDWKKFDFHFFRLKDFLFLTFLF